MELSLLWLDIWNPRCLVEMFPKLEKDCTLSLGLIAANQPDYHYQQLIVDAGAIVPTVKLLKRREICCVCTDANAVIRRTADIVTNIAHDNPRIKTNIRVESGIPPLVELLDFPDVIQRAFRFALVLPAEIAHETVSPNDRSINTKINRSNMLLDVHHCFYGHW